MPSPDVVSYTGLELLDVDAQALLDEALANAGISFPDWTPREGNTEVVLLEEFAAMAEDVVYAVNQLPNGLAELLLRMFGLERDSGAPPYAEVRFTVTDATGYTIDQGTTVRLDLGDAEPLDFTTDTDLVIPEGSTEGTVLASASEATILANGRAAGTELELLDAITHVEAVTLNAPVAGGRLAEDGVAFLDRGAPLLTRLTTTLVRPEAIEAYLGENPDVVRLKVLDLYNPATPSIPPGNSPGYVTAAVAGPAGTSVGTTARQLIEADLRNRMHAGLAITVVDADVTILNVSVTVLKFPTADDAEVAAAVEGAVRAYLNPDVWAWDKLVRVNELIAAVDAAAGVDAVLDVTAPDGDVVLNGYAPLVKAGTVTVTIEAPA